MFIRIYLPRSHSVISSVCSDTNWNSDTRGQMRYRMSRQHASEHAVYVCPYEQIKQVNNTRELFTQFGATSPTSGRYPPRQEIPSQQCSFTVAQPLFTTFSPNHYPCDLYLRPNLRYENLCSLPLTHTPVFTINSKTLQRSTLYKRDQPYTIEINSTHKRSTLHTQVQHLMLVYHQGGSQKHSSPKTQNNSFNPGLGTELVQPPWLYSRVRFWAASSWCWRRSIFFWKICS